MDSIILCHHPRDEAFAHRLAAFLEMNLPMAVSCSEGIVTPDLDLVEATERALSAEAALILLSPDSVPKTWHRATWEPVFFEKPKQFQTLLGFVLVSDCRFPPLLRRERFFDASNDPLPAMREIKRWLLRPTEPANPPAPADPAIDALQRLVADQPGAAFDIDPAPALRFAVECEHDFEAVWRFDFRGRGRKGIVGDICAALGLPFAGRIADDIASLKAWCAGHRSLFLLAGVKTEDREFATPGGRCSAIFTPPTDELLGAIPSATADAVRKFEATSGGGDTDRLRLGWTAVNLLKTQGRCDEVLEILEAMAAIARSLGDRSALLRIEREQYWTQVRQSSEEISVAISPFPGLEQQLTLPF